MICQAINGSIVCHFLVCYLSLHSQKHHSLTDRRPMIFQLNFTNQVMQLTLTLKVTNVVETSVTVNNSPIQDYAV